MSCQSLMITKESYGNLKEYWDYQRLLEYNKELLRHRLSQMQGNVFTQFGALNTTDMFDDIWINIESKDLEEPYKGWIPQNEDYRFEWEGEPDRNAKIPERKGRPVILRAKRD